jgi:beta-lactamase regulating signal transducer with metallopeptidase domain
MVLAWMVYASVLTALVAGGSFALDRLAGIWNVPRRLVWCAALALAVLTPIAIVVRPAAPVAGASVRIIASREAPSVATPAGRMPMRLSEPRIPNWHLAVDWDRPAKAGWVAASLFLLALFSRGVRTTRRLRAEWRIAELDGRRVFVGNDFGPAVVGTLRPDIVVPQWALELPAVERDLMLRHETEHVRAKDPLLLALAGIALLMFPWNAALWLIVNRLRLAIEIDCDARVLRAAGNPRDYGLLLIAVGARHSLSLPMAASLAERRPLLERRILAMTMLRPSRPIVASIPFAALVFAAAIAVAQAPTPEPGPRRTVSQSGHITAEWSEAPIRTVIQEFGRFSGFKMAQSSAVRGTITAKVIDEPWDTALATIMAGAGYAVRADPDSTIRIDTYEALGIQRPGAAPKCCDVSMDSLAAWMVIHHPNVVRGDTTVGTVVFVIDANGAYVSSVTHADTTDSAPPGGSGMRGRVGGPGAVTARAGPVPGAEAQARTFVRASEVHFGSPDGMKKMFNLDVANEAIDGIEILKLPAGKLAPRRIGVITVWLKR